MPRHQPEPGLAALLPHLLLFLAAPLLVLFARARWRRAADRREEVRRLLLRASEEARIAEFESAKAYGYASDFGAGFSTPAFSFSSSSSTSPSQDADAAAKPKLCAVCHSPTTTRCARCKAVRYCSGKCQIVHWRQGHKDECRPPDTVQNDASGSGPISMDATAESKSLQDMDSCTGETEPRESYVESRTSVESTSSTIFTEETDSEVRISASTSDTSTVSSPAHSAPVSNSETSNSAFTGANHVHAPPVESDNGSSHEISYMSSRNTAVIHKPVHRKLPSISTSETFVNTSNDLTEGTETRQPVLDDKNSSSIKLANHQTLRYDSTSSHSSGQKDSYNCKSAQADNLESTACQKESMPHYYGRILSSKNSDVIEQKLSRATELSESNADQARSRSKSSKSVPDSSSSNRPFSSGNFPISGGGNSSAVVGGSQPNKLSPEMVNSSANYGLKTSVRKVVDQLRPSKPSRLYKTLFPYDLFTKLYNEKVELHPCGLTNVGNSCYANVVLQCLVFTRPLTSYLLQGLHKKTCATKDWCFTCELESLVLKMKQRKSPISPTGILSQIQNIGCNLSKGKEEDAHEFLRCAIDHMQSVCIKEAGENAVGKLAETTLMQLIFGGYLRSKIKCMRCHGKSERYERMLDLTVEIQGEIRTLDEALTRFTKCELLDGENKYQCNRCKSYERAKKEMKIAEAPNILTIALKRFQSGKFGKINKTVTFPEILNLAPYMVNSCDDKSPVYGLYAVVVHLDIMNAAFSGHYVCYIKNSSEWYKIDDSLVKPVEVDRVLSKGAYMLLYARCSPRAPSLAKEMIPVGSGKMRNRSQEASSAGQNRGSGSDAFLGRYSPLYNKRYMSDSSSDNSSLFGSCSDEGSCSTESTRDSASIDDQSWDSDSCNWNNTSSSGSSPYRWFEEFEGSACSPSPYSQLSEATCPCAEGSTNAAPETPRYRRAMSYSEGGGHWRQDGSTPVFLHSDTTKPCRKLTGQHSSFRETTTNRVKPNERTGTRD